MKTAALSLLMLAGSLQPLRAELPSIKVPPKYLECRQDGDCAVAGDACRSCGEPIIINKKHLKWFNDLDQKLRRKMGFTPVCEACGLERAQPRCVKKKCSKGKQVDLK